MTKRFSDDELTTQKKTNPPKWVEVIIQLENAKQNGVGLEVPNSDKSNNTNDTDKSGS